MRKIIMVLMTVLILSGCHNQMNHVDKKTSEEANVQTVESKAFETYQKGIEPSKIKIKRINVNHELDHTGTNQKNEMAVPKDIDTPSWFKDGFKVGELGNAVIAGHVDDGVNPGVFTNLHKLQKGDKVEVSDRNNKKLVFKVYDKKLYKLREAPVDKIFGYSSNRHLNLITCEGDYNASLGSTPNRLVVYTKLING